MLKSAITRPFHPILSPILPVKKALATVLLNAHMTYAHYSL